MSEQTELRDTFLETLNHIDGVLAKLRTQCGMNRPFTFPDQHKLSEGLFLSAWTHWEQYIRGLLILDLATSPDASLLRRVRSFRTKRAGHAIAEYILDHPDENRFIEWSSPDVALQRAAAFLGPGNRFPALQPHLADLNRLKKVRNAIAHKSDDAWKKFRAVVQAPPFNLTPPQMKGLTAGRFLASHSWNGNFVLDHALAVLRQAAVALVP